MGRKVKGGKGDKVEAGIWPTQKFRRGAPYGSGDSVRLNHIALLNN